MRPGWRWQAWVSARVAVPALLFIGCFTLTLLSDFATSRYQIDKSWFLDVVDRVTSGDVLYRDTYFPATPLSVYLTALLTAPFGNELLVAEAVWTAWLVLLILVAVGVARQLGWPSRARLWLAAALTVVMAPWVHSPYTLLAMVWFLVCCSATLAWVSRPSDAVDQGDRWLLVAGTAAGLCFVSKHNLGVYASLALAVATATYGGGWVNRRQWPRIVALSAGPFLLVTAVVLLPILATGGMAKLLEYGFSVSEAYLNAARIGYGDGLLTLGTLLKSAASGAVSPTLYWQLLYLLPPITLAALAIAWPRAAPGERQRVTTIGAFVVAACLVMFPRATLSYLVFTLPVVLPALGYAGRVLAPHAFGRQARALGVAAVLWLIIGAALIARQPIAAIASGGYDVSDLPHLRGVLIAPDAKPYFQTAEKLAGLDSRNEAPLLLSTRAGFLYLASGGRNPTPYDYPLVTTFGPNGLAETIDALRRGAIQAVCVDHDFSSTNDARRLQPATLLLYVEQAMAPRRDLGTCTLYRGLR